MPEQHRPYRDGQFKNIVPFVQYSPKWLLLGGPADGNEAQCAKQLWPGIRVLASEPVDLLRIYQLSNGFPEDGILVPHALSNEEGFANFNIIKDNPRCSSFMEDRKGEPFEVETTTLDNLNLKYGPFTDALLWLDIEGWEYKALQGATKLLRSGDIMLVNVEFLERRTEVNTQIDLLLRYYGFKKAHEWNLQPGLVKDCVYTLE